MKYKHGKSDYQAYFEALSPEEQAFLEQYFKRIRQSVLLSKKESRRMLFDFEKAFLFYSSIRLPLREAALRLDPSHLGGFYARPPVLWYPLDDAAKIYPLSMDQNQMAIFRLSAYLYEEVIPEILQIALTFTIKRFPYFATTIKKGFFWHYIDSTKKHFSIEPESDMVCRPMNVSYSGAQSFRIIYYKNRISVEFFHILTDGTGGTIFLKTLVAEYLRLCKRPIPARDGVLDIDDLPTVSESENAFSHVPETQVSGFMDKAAVQMSGKLSRVRPCQVIHFTFDSKCLQQTAKQKNTSVTALMLACLFVAGKAATDETAGNIQIQVPVNMRKFYPSDTIRNFAMYCCIRIPISQIKGIDDLLPEITKQLSENASKQAMDKMMNATVKLVRTLNYIPLFVKRPAARLIYGFLGDKVFTNTLSNLGVIRLPDEMAPFVQKMDFILGTSITNRASCAMVTVNDSAVLSVTKLTSDPSFENKLWTLFQDNGLSPQVTGSENIGN